MIWLCLLLSAPARADVVPPSPPREGMISEDLPPPPLPGGEPPWALGAAAAGALALLGAAVFKASRRDTDA